MSTYKDGWKPTPRTSDYIDLLTELDLDDDSDEGLRPHNYFKVTQMEDGLNLAGLQAGITMSVSFNRRTLNRKYVSKPLFILAVTSNNTLLRGNWRANNAGMVHPLSFNEYAFYDAQAIIEAI